MADKTFVLTEGFDRKQRLVLTLGMSCEDWDRAGAALSCVQGDDEDACDNLSKVILKGLIEVGYFTLTS